MTTTAAAKRKTWGKLRTQPSQAACRPAASCPKSSSGRRTRTALCCTALSSAAPPCVRSSG